MLPTKFQVIWTSGFRGEEFLKSANMLPTKFPIIWPSGFRGEDF
jgi:hypothetical protein